MFQKTADVSQSDRKSKNNLFWFFFIFPLIFGIASFNFKKQLIEPSTEIQVNQKNLACNFPEQRKRPTFIAYDGLGPNSNTLKDITAVLSFLNMDKIELNERKPEDIPMNSWNLLWTFRHHTFENIDWSKLKSHQKINHWPGNYGLASKSHLASRIKSKYIPPGFLKADDVREYAKQHPDKRFVMKLKSNRGVKLVKPSEMNFTVTNSYNDYFAQEYVENPLLWDGHKFDFNIFVAITSVDPLRLYYYEKNIYMRFTPKPYNASSDDEGTYIIADDHMNIGQFEPVNKYLSNGYTTKEAFENFIKSKGGKVDEIWLKVEDLIRSVVLKGEKTIIDGVIHLNQNFNQSK